MPGGSAKPRKWLNIIFLLSLIAVALVFCLALRGGNWKPERPGKAEKTGKTSYIPPVEQQFPAKQLDLLRGSQIGAKISLAGAANEYLLLQFRVQGADLASLKVGVTGRGVGREIGYKFYQLSWAPAASRGKFAPDALKPLDLGLVDTGSTVEIWATIKISAGLKGGLYPQEIVFSDKKASYKQLLEVRVWNFALPDDLPITLMGNLWDTKSWFARYGVNSPSQYDSVIKEYLRVMREYKFNALGPRFYPFPVMQLVNGKKVEDIPGYHRMVSYALNELRYRYFCIPLLGKDKKNLKDPGSMLMKHYNTFYPLFNDYVKRNRWENRAVNKVLDEPRPETYADVYEVYAQSKRLAPAIKTLCPGRAPEVQFAKVIDFWVTSALSFDPGKITAARNAGQEIWLYVNRLQKLHQPLVSPRLIGWFLYRHKFSGYFFWCVNYWGTDPWTAGIGVGDDARRYRGGTFFYPNPANGSPLPTTRLEAMRRGFQDYQYFILLDQARAQGRVDPKTYDDIRRAVDGLTEGLKGGIPRATMGQLESLRYRIGELLNQAGS